MKKVMLVFGTRSEAIKMAPLVKKFQKKSADFETIVYVTGWYREMLDRVSQMFDTRPNYDLNIMKQGQDLCNVAACVLTGMRDVLNKAKPDVVLVHGDTATSTVTTPAAFYQQVPVGHVEAGLYTHNIYSPWPEEMNRQITGRAITYHFSLTALSKKSPLTEGVREDKIAVTGNAVIDALHIVVDKIKTDGALQQELAGVLGKADCDTSRLADGKKLVLITRYRRENFGGGSISMCTIIKDLMAKYPHVDSAYPMHLNPSVHEPIHEVFRENLNSLGNMFLIEPLEYLSFMFPVEKATLVLTNSGDIRKEAPRLGKPVLMIRDTTEHPGMLDAGTVRLVGTDYNKIVSEVSILLDDASAYEQVSKTINPYGDGKARICITQTLNVRL